jgi:hypothetical protein
MVGLWHVWDAMQAHAHAIYISVGTSFVDLWQVQCNCSKISRSTTIACVRADRKHQWGVLAQPEHDTDTATRGTAGAADQAHTLSSREMTDYSELLGPSLLVSNCWCVC